MACARVGFIKCFSREFSWSDAGEPGFLHANVAQVLLVIDARAEEVEGVGGGGGVDLREGLPRARRQPGDVPPRLVGYVVQLGVARRAEDVDDAAELLHVVRAREERLPPEQLAEDAPHRPDVDGFGVRCLLYTSDAADE